MKYRIAFLYFIILNANLFASLDNVGLELPLYSILPFIGILLSIALAPLLAPLFWHHNYGKISAFWALIFIVPFTLWSGFTIAISKLLHVLILEYFPFIILLFSLYTISGGIHIKGKLSGTPKGNLLILLVGTLLASWMGTTGASMLLIRPLLRANKWRKHTVHIVVFFIFLVANIGGALTPLGDPPLFLGFLHGVDFFWTTKIMIIPMFYISLCLFIIFYILDNYYYRKENYSPFINDKNNASIRIEGLNNIILLLGVISTVAISGIWKPDIDNINVFGIYMKLQNIIRDCMLVALSLLSIRITDSKIRNINGFTWHPILEVSKLFAGIFITIIPAISILQAGLNGALGSIVMLVTDSQGNPVNIMYFWLTGILSSFLDNAPTYLVFFNLAGSAAPEGIAIADYLMHNIPNTLMAISSGAVFMGAMTYIGNAPNFMVQSIAEENNVNMPSFFGFMLWSILILIPIFSIVTIMIF